MTNCAKWVLENIPLDKHILTEFLEAGYFLSGTLFPTETGIGIGCSLSPVIVNMTLDGLQDYIYQNLQKGCITPDYNNGDLVRYADDIIVAARTKEMVNRVVLMSHR